MPGENFHGKLYSRYGKNNTSSPTRHQVERHLNTQPAIAELAELGVTDPEILSLLSSPCEGQDRLAIFTSWLSHYIDQHGPEVTEAITVDCIKRSTGHIHEKKLKRKLRKYRRNGKQ